MQRLLRIKGLKTGCIMLISLSSAVGQSVDFASIKDTFSAGNSHELSEYLDFSVEITWDTNTKIYSRTEAEQVIKDFFRKNKPRSFVFKHTGSSKEGSYYAIGDYVSTDIHYTVLIRLRENQGKQRIHELSFVPE